MRRPGGSVSGWSGLPVAVCLHPGSYRGRPGAVSALKGRSGWLRVSRATLDTYVATYVRTLCAACDEDGEPLTQWQTGMLFEMDAALPQEVVHRPPEELDAITDDLYQDFLGACDLATLAALERAENTENLRVALVEVRAAALIRRADRVIEGLAREKRRVGPLAARQQRLPDRIERIEALQERLAVAMRNWRRWRRERFARIEANHLDSLRLTGEVEELYTVQWNVTATRRPMEIRLPLLQTELRNPGYDVNSEVSRNAERAEAHAYMARLNAPRPAAAASASRPVPKRSALAKTIPPGRAATAQEDRTDNEAWQAEWYSFTGACLPG